MGAIASQITSLAIAYSTVYLYAHQRKHHSSASLTFVRGIHRWPVNSPHKRPATRRMCPFDDVIMIPWNVFFHYLFLCCTIALIIIHIICDHHMISKRLDNWKVSHAQTQYLGLTWDFGGPFYIRTAWGQHFIQKATLWIICIISTSCMIKPK